MQRIARRLFQTLPPVRRRDDRIGELAAQLAQREHALVLSRAKNQKARARTTRPSFLMTLERERRLAKIGQAIGSSAPRHNVQSKLRAQEIAHSCGVATPNIYAKWPDVESIDLKSLPDEFVLKSIGGASARGVLPLRRTAGGHEIISRDETITIDDIRNRFTELEESGDIGGPYFAEEFLHGTTGDAIPLDIKVYTFYGDIGQILLRRVGRHARKESVTSKYIDESGGDLGSVSLDRKIDPSIPTPQLLGDVVDAARTLSLATRLAFVRVDLYETRRGIVFGELTPRPGNPQRYQPRHDLRMGEMWEMAQARLDRDIAAGMPFAHDLGSEHAESR